MADASLGILLFVAYRELERRVLEEVRAAGFEATLAQARIFQRIDERRESETAHRSREQRSAKNQTDAEAEASLNAELNG